MTPNQRKRELEANKGLRVGDYVRVRRHSESHDAAARVLMRQIPSDTRTPAQVLMGDPIPNDLRRRRG